MELITISIVTIRNICIVLFCAVGTFTLNVKCNMLNSNSVCVGYKFLSPKVPILLLKRDREVHLFVLFTKFCRSCGLRKFSTYLLHHLVGSVAKCKLIPVEVAL